MRALLKWQYSVAATVCLLGVALAILLFANLRGQQYDEIYTDFARSSEDHVAALKTTLEFDFLQVRSVKSFYGGSQEITRKKFSDFVAPLIENHASIRALQWVPRVLESNRAEWDRIAIREGLADYSIQERDRSGILAPAKGRKEYYPAFLVEPDHASVVPLGFDLASDPECLAAMTQACDSGKLTLTNKISLNREPGNKTGLRLFLAVYHSNTVPNTVDERRRSLRGYVVGVLRMKEIFEESFSGLALTGIDVRLQDTTDSRHPTDLHVHKTRLSPLADRDLAFDTPSDFRHVRTLDIGGRRWTITSLAAPAFIAAKLNWYPWGGAAATLILTSLLAGYLIMLAKRNADTTRFAEDLARSNQRLKHEIAERKQAQLTLQISQTKYRTLYESSNDAIMLLSPQDGLLNGNGAALALFGFSSEEELISRRVSELSPTCQPSGRSSSGEVQRMMSLALRQGSQVFEWKHKRLDNTEFDALVMLTRMEIDGKRVLQAVVRDITEQKELERSLRENEKYLQGIFDTVATGILAIDAETHVITDANRSAAEELGLPLSEIIGHKCSEFFDCLGQEGKVCPLASNQNQIRHLERRLRRPDGSRVPVLKSVAPLSINGKKYLLDCFVNIAAQKDAEEALQRETAKLSAMISGMEEGVVFADSDNVIVEINAYLCRLLGKTRQELVGQRIDELHRGSIRDRLLEQIDRFRENAAAPPLVLQRSLAGTEVIMRMQPIHRDGKYDGVLLNVVDVSELVKARRQAEVANEAKSRFLASMSHEIRTPMTAILGYTDLLTDPTITPSNRNNYLAIIRRSGEHLLKLINDILDLSKIEAGKMSLDLQRCSLISVLADVTSLMRPRAEQRGVSLSVEYRGAIPETILTDGARLRQAVVNLVGNAVKFTRRGSIRIVASFDPHWKDHQPAVQIQVVDTGIGIRSDVLSQLFRPFTQGDLSVAERFGGTGLGLAISRHIAELLGGELKAQSVWGAGSTFTLTLPAGNLEGIPLLEQPAEAHPDTAHHSWNCTAHELEGIRVLLAEDGFDNRELIQALLQRAGATIETAENGRIAVAKAQADQFDVILMDINMPEMDGYQATRMLRDQGYLRPILALTANAMSGDNELCLAAGCNEHLAKPIDRVKLIQTIARYARNNNSPTENTTADHQEPTATNSDQEDCLISQFINDPEIASILEHFVERLDEQVRAMRQAWLNQEHLKLQRLAHRLKGAGGSYGYPSLSEAAGVLENSAKACDGSAEAEVLEHIATIVRAVKDGYAETAQGITQ